MSAQRWQCWVTQCVRSTQWFITLSRSRISLLSSLNKVNTLRASPQSLSWLAIISTSSVQVIALRGSTPKRDTQQQCVCTINTAKPCHAMSHHDIKCNTIQVQPVQCNPVPFHATPYRAIPCNAMPPHAIQRHSLLIQYHTMQRHVTSCHAMEIRAI